MYFCIRYQKRATFDELDYWVNKVDELLGGEPILSVVANKSDLKENVKKSEGEEYAKKIGASFYQMSAKNDKGGFEKFVDKLIEEFLRKKNIYGWEIISKDDDRYEENSKIALQKSKKEDSLCNK